MPRSASFRSTKGLHHVRYVNRLYRILSYLSSSHSESFPYKLHELKRRGEISISQENGRMVVRPTNLARALIWHHGFVGRSWGTMSEKQKEKMAKILLEGIAGGKRQIHSDLIKLGSIEKQKVILRKNKSETDSIEETLERLVEKIKAKRKHYSEIDEATFHRWALDPVVDTGVNWTRKRYVKGLSNLLSVYRGVLSGVREGKYRL